MKLSPTSCPELVSMLKKCHLEKTPVLVQGRGTRTGSSSADDSIPAGCVQLSLEKLSDVLEVNSDSLWMKVLAGTQIKQTIETAKKSGCRPLGFGSENRETEGTVGGWLATHATIQDAITQTEISPILSLEAVLPNGNLIRGVATPRSATGPDIFSLFLGTYGTFGVIAQACIKLEPIPESKRLVGFSLTSQRRMFEFINKCLCNTFAPKNSEILINTNSGQKKNKIKNRIWLNFEGDNEVVQTAIDYTSQLAKDLAARSASQDELLSWQNESLETSCHLEAHVLWSQIDLLTRQTKTKIGPWNKIHLDRLSPIGARLRIQMAEKSIQPETKAIWAKLTDPNGVESAAKESTRDKLGQIKRQLDPEGLINPHTRPWWWLDQDRRR